MFDTNVCENAVQSNYNNNTTSKKNTPAYLYDSHTNIRNEYLVSYGRNVDVCLCECVCLNVFV